MSPTSIYVLVAFALLLLFGYLATRRSRELRNVDQAFTAIRSLDIEAFRNLMDPEDEDFLRARLSPREFRRIQRERRRAALAYARAVSVASLEFARLGDAARRNPDPAIAASGRQISENATYLRFRALTATANLAVAAAFPRFGPRPLRSLLDQYDRAAHLLQTHNGLERTRRRAS